MSLQSNKIAGIVNDDGTIAAGSGFTVNKIGKGRYMLTFTQAFVNQPAVVTTILDSYKEDHSGRNSYVASITNNTAEVVTGNRSSEDGDYGFSFIAMES